MKHNEDGQNAEAVVVKYLLDLGYEIIDKNWKTKQCEVDIIAKKDSCIHFVEVKYRSRSSQGEGFDYITKAKLRQMSFAAQYWVSKYQWAGEYVLSGASVSGGNFDVEYIEQI